MKNSEVKGLCAGMIVAVMAISFAVCRTDSIAGLMDNQEETKRPSLSDAELASSTDTTVQTTTNITMTFGDTVIKAVLDDSETSRTFIKRLPMTLTMERYADREYYASIEKLPENGEAIEDFENGDVTYYTTGSSLAVFFGNADSSSQRDLIRMGRITSELSLFDKLGNSSTVTISLSESETAMTDYDFSAFTNVKIAGINLSTLSDKELSVLYRQVKYCQAMTEADTNTMAKLMAEDVMFTHMSGRQQTRAEYFADIENGSLRYFTIGIENPVIEVNGDFASITYTSVLDANAYGARGTYRMEGTHQFENIDGQWVSTNEARIN